MPETVLIIDPDDRRRAFARDVLGRAGYDVRAATDAHTATAMLDGRTPAAVVVVAAPPRAAWLASCPVVVVATPGSPPPEETRIAATVAPLDRADLLAAVWVATNP